MSSQQPTLTDFATEDDQAAEDSVEVMEGARYGRARERTPQHPPADAGQCTNCGNDISAYRQRIIGDEHGRVPVCDRHDCQRDLFGGTIHQAMSIDKAVMRAKTRGVGQ